MKCFNELNSKTMNRTEREECKNMLNVLSTVVITESMNTDRNSIQWHNMNDFHFNCRTPHTQKMK